MNHFGNKTYGSSLFGALDFTISITLSNYYFLDYGQYYPNFFKLNKYTSMC